jgi:hypothetical protein
MLSTSAYVALHQSEDPLDIEQEAASADDDDKRYEDGFLTGRKLKIFASLVTLWAGMLAASLIFYTDMPAFMIPLLVGVNVGVPMLCSCCLNGVAGGSSSTEEDLRRAPRVSITVVNPDKPPPKTILEEHGFV